MYQMIVTEGPNRGHLFTLQPGENRLGRDPEVEIIVPDNRVSRLHAVINQQINGFVVTDAGSRNGIYLNGIRCEEALLCPGDELMVGGVKMLVLASVEEVEEALGLTLYSTIGLSLEGQEGSVALPTMPQTYLIGGSKPMQSVNRLIFRAAQSGTTTLITGESGTGKELVASAVHRNSPRRRMPFVPLNGAVLGGATPR